MRPCGGGKPLLQLTDKTTQRVGLPVEGKTSSGVGACRNSAAKLGAAERDEACNALVRRKLSALNIDLIKVMLPTLKHMWCFIGSIVHVYLKFSCVWPPFA